MDGKTVGEQQFEQASSQPHRQSISSTVDKICRSCLEPIHGKYVCVNGSYFHQDHFRCSYCNMDLHTLPNNIRARVKENKFYCPDDFQRLFCPKCRTCDQHIVEGNVIRALGHFYHPHHFVCKECNLPFQKGRYYESKGHPYCYDHYSSSLCKCFSCGKIVEDDDVLTVGGKNFHVDCLKCYWCDVILVSKGFIFQKNDHVYCLDDYQKLFSKICTGCGEHITKQIFGVNNEEYYHHKCLSCSVCSKALTEYICVGGDLRCSAHANEYVTSVCTICNLNIPDDDVVRCCGVKTHKQCFNCKYCSSPLTKLNARILNGDLQCLTCLLHNSSHVPEAFDYYITTFMKNGNPVNHSSTGTTVVRTNADGNNSPSNHSPSSNDSYDQHEYKQQHIKPRMSTSNPVPLPTSRPSSNSVYQMVGSTSSQQTPSPASASSPAFAPSSPLFVNTPNPLTFPAPPGRPSIGGANMTSPMAPSRPSVGSPTYTTTTTTITRISTSSNNPAPSPMSLPMNAPPSIPDDRRHNSISINPSATPGHSPSSQQTSLYSNQPTSTPSPAYKDPSPSSQSQTQYHSAVMAPPIQDKTPIHNRRKSIDEENVGGTITGTETTISWKKGEMLGKGSFGKVYLGMDNITGQLMAVKQIPLKDNVEIDMTQIYSEIEMMQKLRHKNIVSLLGTQKTTNRFNIFMEYIPGNSLDHMLEKFGPFVESVIQNYTRQLLEALDYCHSQGVVHRDLKAKNVLLDTSGNVKLADFGSAKIFHNVLMNDSPSMSYNYTPLWTAPEVILGDYNSKVDIWALGCVVIEMATGKPPWNEKNFENAFRALNFIGSSNEIPGVPHNLSDDAQDFMLQCLQRNPDLRPSAGQLLKHKWVRSNR